jgi:hybrid cluster-associated redox disulfide protein
MSEKSTITADMTIAEVLSQYPNTETTLVKYKLHCVGCNVASFETIQEGAVTHGVKELDALLRDLNAATK